MLRALLRARGRTPVDLAAALHVDVSLVRRWLRGDRAPALGSTYLERIGAFLDLERADGRRLEAAQIAYLRRGRAGGKAQTVDDSFARAAGLLVERALDRSARPAELIYTLDGDAPGPLVGEWLSAQRRALGAGWSIVVLARLDDPSRAAGLSKALRPLLDADAGQRVRVLALAGATRPPLEIAVVAGEGALLGLATGQAHAVDAALSIDEPEQVEQLHAFLRQVASRGRAARL